MSNSGHKLSKARMSAAIHVDRVESSLSVVPILQLVTGARGDMCNVALVNLRAWVRQFGAEPVIKCHSGASRMLYASKVGSSNSSGARRMARRAIAAQPKQQAEAKSSSSGRACARRPQKTAASSPAERWVRPHYSRQCHLQSDKARKLAKKALNLDRDVSADGKKLGREILHVESVNGVVLLQFGALAPLVKWCSGVYSAIQVVGRLEEGVRGCRRRGVGVVYDEGHDAAYDEGCRTTRDYDDGIRAIKLGGGMVYILLVGN
ncbi:hypothetical protein GGX14DRAFT_394990 [Mycena pura]|uniref:Uncharacterized protein n=1 Tax=Mycena pura TaxID=153505 RepID=A0AAD6VCW0_9AGAR|nr:hypothetical protein GGX14DRAFT_394990 [Mycena pura]